MCLEQMRPTSTHEGSVAIYQKPTQPISRKSGSVATGKEPMRPTPQ